MSPCDELVDGKGKVIGYMCMAPERVKLGNRLWLEFNEWTGPVFFRSEHSEKEIIYWWKSERIAKLFDEWIRNYRRKEAPGSSAT